MKSELNNIMPTRRTRRRLVISTLLFSAISVMWLMIYGDADSEIHQQLSSDLVYLAGIVVLGYAVSASADNVAVFNRLPRTPRQPKQNSNYAPPLDYFDGIETPPEESHQGN